MKNYLDALKRRKEETGESGFSLIELIVVVVILGVLAAIAIPIFSNLQADAQESSLKTVAANGASQIAATIADGGTVTETSASNLNDSDEKITVTVTGTTLENFCVTASKEGVVESQSSGPGCPEPTEG